MNKLRVGIVGLGFMGRTHWQQWARLPSAEVVALCESDPQILATAQAQAGHERDGMACPRAFPDLQTLLDARLVDAVSITLPTDLHADATIQSLKASVHVFCEKPMALTIPDCDRMVAAADESGGLLQIGQCIRFWPEYFVTGNLVRSGRYGRVVASSFRRFTAVPRWSPDSWFADPARSGGQPLDLHIHDSDYVHYLFGLPVTVCSLADPAQSYISTQYRYPDGPPVVAESTWRMAPSFGFSMSFVIVLERATVLYDLTHSPTLRVLPHDAPAFTPELPPGDGYSREIEHFARAVAGEKVEPITSPEQSRDSVRLVLAEQQSAREGRAVNLADSAEPENQ
jgi:predicted dehydrogenase